MSKILFVEDEPALQKTLGAALQEKGYEILPALNGEDGLRLARAEKPDLILLDLVLPKLSGFDVLKALKDGQETKNIPVIVLTQLETAQDIEKVLSLGATTYLVKANYTLQEVIEKVEKALENRN